MYHQSHLHNETENEIGEINSETCLTKVLYLKCIQSITQTPDRQ